MPRDQFNFRKENQLKKDDKSLKQSWDLKIINLCDKINSLDNYYTTSSCSGRVVILKDSKEKRDDLFIFVSHDEISFKQLKEEIEKIKFKDLIYFKCDPVILHVSCRTLKDCQNLIGKAMEAGWKRNGIISSDKRFVVELNATGKLEFPLFKDGKLLVDDNFLELIVSESNRKLKKSWEKINRLKKEL